VPAREDTAAEVSSALGLPPWAFVLCAGATIALLWSVRYLPMVDLPQHTAQLSYWIHYDDPAFGFAEQLRINWFSPYLLGYALARAAALVLPVAAALKLVITLSILALPLAMDRLLRYAGGDRWWALLGFPLGLGFAFQWGFFNWMVALPLFLWLLPATLEYARSPSPRGAVLLALVGAALFFAHGLMMVFFVLVAGASVLYSARSLRRAALPLLPLLVPLGVAVCWRFWGAHNEVAFAPMPTGPPWKGFWSRPLIWMPLLTGTGNEPSAAGVGFAMAALLFMRGLTPSPQLLRRAPFLVTAVCYGLGPFAAMTTAFVNVRFAVLLIPTALLALERGRPRAPARPLQIATLLLVLGWVGYNAVRFQRFDREARSFDEILARAEPRRRLLYLPFEAGFPGFSAVPFLHFSAYYQAQKGGTINFSFAGSLVELVQYRPGHVPPTRPLVHVWPSMFDWSLDGGYDYYLVRASDPRPLHLFPPEAPVTLVARAGQWWLYQQHPRTALAPAPPPSSCSGCASEAPSPRTAAR
jgi:hypothetical protein